MNLNNENKKLKNFLSLKEEELETLTKFCKSIKEEYKILKQNKICNLIEKKAKTQWKETEQLVSSLKGKDNIID